MKNISKSLIALFAVLAFSCNSDDVQDRPIITGIDAPVLIAPEEGNAYVLLEANAAIQAERFVWSKANFGQEVAVNYEVELDKAGNEFANPQSLGAIIGGSQLSVSVVTLNTAVMAVGGEAEVESLYEVRVKASVNDTFEPMYSNLMSISVTPYVNAVIVDPVLFLIGSPQGYYGLGQWDNATALKMRHIGSDNAQIFEGYVKVATGDEFKFIDAQADWAALTGNYGVIGGSQNGNLENSAGSGNLKIAATDGDGLYYIWVDLDNLKYKAIKMDWGIIGDATPGGWDGETAMAYDFASNQYTITAALSNGAMKFRSSNTGNFIYNGQDNAAWKFNVGVSDPTVTYNADAGNFPITGGNYTLGLTVNFDGTAVVSGL